MSLEPQIDTEPDQAKAERRDVRILVVDDDVTQRALLSQAAKLCGHAVTGAASCGEALEQLKAAKFDCVTLDLQLEDGCGLAVLEAMSKLRYAGTVIIISGMDGLYRTAARRYARWAGVELQSLPKPIDLSALRVCFADLGKTAAGLPAVHSWGGVASDRVADEHRDTTP